MSDSISVPRAFAEKLLAAIAGVTTATPEPASGIRITDIERDVLVRLAAGMNNRAIAMARGVSVKTIDSQRANLMHKTGTVTNACIARYAIRHRLLIDHLDDRNAHTDALRAIADELRTLIAQGDADA